MECNDNHGIKHEVPAAAGRRGLKRKCGARGAGGVRLSFTAAVPGAPPARPVQGNLLSPGAPAVSVFTHLELQNSPFMNNMDEISYWIYTKRAPCLLNYDNIVKKQVEQAQCSTNKPPSVKSKTEDEPSPRKKRKLKLLDDDSASTEKQQNIYFKTPHNQKTALSSCKSNADGSDIDFNIKSSSAQKKSKKIKLQRNCQPRVPKKNKVATSTPKIRILRRSLRTAQRKYNNLNCTFQIYNASVVNGKQDAETAEETKQPDKVTTNDRSKCKVMLPEKGTNEVVLNGQFEDLSDVSGFTANYIRSTKVQLSKRPNKLRNRNSRNLSKQTKQRREQHDKMIMCVNKSVNTGLPDTAALNCSTGSSQNVLKLVTVQNNEQPVRVNKSTSLLKFMEAKLDGSNTNSKINKRESKSNLNISFQSRSSGASRYPRRHKNNTTETPEPHCSTNLNNNSKATASGRKYNMRKGALNLDRKENSEEKVVSRARSGRRKGLKIDVEDAGCSVLQLNSSTEQVSSSHAVNVACPNIKSAKKNNTTSRCLRSRTLRDKVGQLCKDSASDRSNKKLSNSVHCALEQSTPKCVKKVKKKMDKTGQSLRDSLRDKSGFAACFSDSDSDIEPLKQHKFFS